jgi:hypothetical protein
LIPSGAQRLAFDSKRVVGGMLTVETIGRIRREHFIKGKTIREIARDLKVSRNTVRKVLPVPATLTCHYGRCATDLAAIALAKCLRRTADRFDPAGMR